MLDSESKISRGNIWSFKMYLTITCYAFVLQSVVLFWNQTRVYTILAINHKLSCLSISIPLSSTHLIYRHYKHAWARGIVIPFYEYYYSHTDELTLSLPVHTTELRPERPETRMYQQQSNKDLSGAIVLRTWTPA